MTKEVRDNFDGLTYDEDDALEFQFMDRNDPKNRGLIKIEGDISRSAFLKLYGSMVKKPKYQLWVRPTEDEKAKDPKAKGHWEKLEN